MAKYRILSLDGGGVRGIISAVVLQRLSAEAGLSGWLDGVDLIAGSSSGGIIALGLAHGLGPGDMRGLFAGKAEEIFDDSWIDDVTDLGGLVGAEYDNTNLERLLRKTFGTTTLAQLQKHVLITAFDLDNGAPDKAARMWKPKLFHNFPGLDSDGAALAYKVALYTSAAPTYFPSVDGYIDGGVYANNPGMCALAQSQDARFPERPPISDVVLLSIGSGTSLIYIKDKNLDWGYAQWAEPLITLMLDGVAGIADYECRQILGGNYHRLAPAFPPGVSIPLDAVDRIPYLVQFAEGLDLTRTVGWLEHNWL